MRNLNRLIPANSGWQLTVARAINDAGQIVGDGILNGQQRAFLLTPVTSAAITKPLPANQIVRADSVDGGVPVRATSSLSFVRISKGRWKRR